MGYMESPMPCCHCGELITNVWIGEGAKGVSHPRCHYLANPYVPKTTLFEVLRNGDDPVMAAHLVCEVREIMAPEVAAFVVEEFNKRQKEKYKRRIQAYEGVV